VQMQILSEKQIWEACGWPAAQQHVEEQVAAAYEQVCLQRQGRQLGRKQRQRWQLGWKQQQRQAEHGPAAQGPTVVGDLLQNYQLDC
jgi:hypothetical protein